MRNAYSATTTASSATASTPTPATASAATRSWTSSTTIACTGAADGKTASPGSASPRPRCTATAASRSPASSPQMRRQGCNIRVVYAMFGGEVLRIMRRGRKDPADPPRPRRGRGRPLRPLRPHEDDGGQRPTGGDPAARSPGTARPTGRRWPWPATRWSAWSRKKWVTVRYMKWIDYMFTRRPACRPGTRTTAMSATRPAHGRGSMDTYEARAGRAGPVRRPSSAARARKRGVDPTPSSRRRTEMTPTCIRSRESARNLTVAGSHPRSLSSRRSASWPACCRPGPGRPGRARPVRRAPTWPRWPRRLVRAACRGCVDVLVVGIDGNGQRPARDEPSAQVVAAITDKLRRTAARSRAAASRSSACGSHAGAVVRCCARSAAAGAGSRRPARPQALEKPVRPVDQGHDAATSTTSGARAPSSRWCSSATPRVRRSPTGCSRTSRPKGRPGQRGSGGRHLRPRPGGEVPPAAARLPGRGHNPRASSPSSPSPSATSRPRPRTFGSSGGLPQGRPGLRTRARRRRARRSRSPCPTPPRSPALRACAGRRPGLGPGLAVARARAAQQVVVGGRRGDLHPDQRRRRLADARRRALHSVAVPAGGSPSTTTGTLTGRIDTRPASTRCATPSRRLARHSDAGAVSCWSTCAPPRRLPPPAASPRAACAPTATAWCRGRNDFGQLGDGTTTLRIRPGPGRGTRLVAGSRPAAASPAASSSTAPCGAGG